MIKPNKYVLPLLLALAFSGTITGCHRKNPEEQISDAKQYIAQHNYTLATLELKSALQARPGDGEARMLLGQALYMSKDYQAAEKEFKKARELGAAADKLLPLYGRLLLETGQFQRVIDDITPTPTLGSSSLAAIHAIRANALISLNRKEDAINTLSVAERHDPQNPEVMLTKARLALLDGKAQIAYELSRAALQINPRFNGALYLMSAAAIAQGKDSEAIAAYNRIIANDPKDYAAHLALADHYMRRNRLDMAGQSIQAAEKSAPNVPIVKYSRAVYELRRGNLRAASDAIQQVLRVAPDHLPSHLVQAVVSTALGNHEQARKSAERLYAKLPGDPLAAKLLITSQLKTGDTKAALATLTPMLAKHSQDPNWLALAGEAYLQAQEYTKATQYLDKAVAYAPNRAELKTKLAASHMAQGDGTQALAILEEAAKLNQRPDQADLSLALLLLQRQDYDQALKTILAIERKSSTNPVTLNLRAAALLGMNDRNGARKALEQALSIQPRFYPAVVNLARMDIQDGKPEAGRQRLESILSQDKNNIQVMLALADLAAAQRQEKEYVLWLERAANADPKAIAPRAGLAKHYLTKKEYNKALLIAREAVSANPDNPDALNLLAATQLGANDQQNAQITYAKLAEMLPNSPDVLLRLAISQINAKETQKARISLRRALDLKSNYVPAQDALIRLEISEGKFDTALNLARQMQSQQPKSPIGYSREAEIHTLQQRHAQAIEGYERALALGAGSSSLIALHEALHRVGKAKEADQRLADWLHKNPSDLVVRSYAAGYHALNGRRHEAIKHYEQIVSQAPNSALALNNLANLYLEVKDPRALQTADRALKLDPANPLILDTRGWILVEQGHASQGIELIRSALAKYPEHPTIRFHLAVSQLKLGDRAAAKRELERLVNQKQDYPEAEQAKTLLRSLGAS